MMDAPSEITIEQLKELNLQIKKSKLFLPFKFIRISDKSTSFFL